MGSIGIKFYIYEISARTYIKRIWISATHTQYLNNLGIIVNIHTKNIGVINQLFVFVESYFSKFLSNLNLVIPLRLYSTRRYLCFALTIKPNVSEMYMKRK